VTADKGRRKTGQKFYCLFASVVVLPAAVNESRRANSSAATVAEEQLARGEGPASPLVAAAADAQNTADREGALGFGRRFA